MAEPMTPTPTIYYRRSSFVTHLPTGHLYSPAHAWIARRADGLWHVGLTKFSVRMLGDMVDHGWELAPGAAVGPGQILGWIEGFKAISDLYCIANGEFAGGNPALKERIQVVNKNPYDEGWLYAVRGEPDSQCMDVTAYQQLLDRTIDRILEQQKTDAEG